MRGRESWGLSDTIRDHACFKGRSYQAAAHNKKKNKKLLSEQFVKGLAQELHIVYHSVFCMHISSFQLTQIITERKNLN